jgi:hypothetical protein
MTRVNKKDKGERWLIFYGNIDYKSQYRSNAGTCQSYFKQRGRAVSEAGKRQKNHRQYGAVFQR